MLVVYDALALESADRRQRFLRIHLPLIATAGVLALVRLGMLVAIENSGQARPHWAYIWLALDVMRRYTTLLSPGRADNLSRD